ncbi:helix-turn-helix domain-containing protein [Paenibacillus cymbidii]|uniref:helix-turn-helix domain-containing protein n=1 Tax=Paenibacillus cymbidii TaxID=1639034 RepID=UPI001081ECF8|nr:helix-turn-helix domain-containing protein [Paenibacillus cymbidii]
MVNTNGGNGRAAGLRRRIRREKGTTDMRTMKMYLARKYWLKMLLTILLLLFLFLAVSSITQYYNSKRTLLDIQDEANRNVLSQVNYNIEYMNELVKNLAISLYFDADSISLLNSPQIDILELTPKLNRLDKVVAYSSFVHSIQIYNSFNHCYYATLSKQFCTEDGMGGLMDRYLSQHASIPKLQFVPMYADSAGDTNQPIPFFSVFLYDSKDPLYKKSSTLVVNVKTEWLFNHINNINKLTAQADSSIVIMDRSGAIFRPDDQPVPGQRELGIMLGRHIAETGKQADYFLQGSGKNRKIISYISSETNGWVIVNVQSYDFILHKMANMRATAIVLVIVFLLLSVIVSVVISRELYKPVERTLKQIDPALGRRSRPLPQGTDEFSFIRGEFHQAMADISLLRQEQAAGKTIMQTFFLRKLILDSATITAAERDSLRQTYAIEVDLERPLLLCVLKIDDYARFEQLPAGDQRLLKFAVLNITRETVAVRFRNEIVDMRNDHLVMLVNAPAASGEEFRPLEELLREAQRRIEGYYRLSFTVAVSDPIAFYGSIDEHYRSALDCAMYRLVHGKSAVIVPAMVASNMSNDAFQFPADTEKHLTEGLRSGNMPLIEEQLGLLFRYLSQLSHPNISYLVLHAVVVTNKVIREINGNSVRQTAVDLMAFHRSIGELETLEEIREAFVGLFRDICAKRKEASAEGINPILVDTIKDIIEANYPDMNLGLQSIATTVQMSTSHVGKIFRLHELVSIAEYITEFRLRQALKLLEENKLSVQEIAEKVGFGNQSYFFKLFKMRFGTTPREYRVKQAIRQQ